MATTTPASPDPTTNKPPRRRRWIPLSLRIFVGMMLLSLCVTAFVGVSAYQQHGNIREIERCGGEVSFRPVGPNWIRSLVGQQRMRLVDEIDVVWFPFNGLVFDKRGVKFINPATVRVGVMPVDDQSLACIANLRQLRSLDLRYSNVSDASLKHLRKLHNLQELKLTCTDVTDGGVGLLLQLRSLKRLNLEATAVTKGGLTELRQGLPHCEVTDTFQPLGH